MDRETAIEMASKSIPSTSIHIDSTPGLVTIDPKKSGKWLWSVTKEQITQKPEFQQAEAFAYQLQAINNKISNRTCICCGKINLKLDAKDKPQLKTIKACQHTVCYNCLENTSWKETVRLHFKQKHPSIFYEIDSLIIDTPQHEVEPFINLYVKCPDKDCNKKCKLLEIPKHLREKHSRSIKKTKALKVSVSPKPTKKETQSPLLTARRLGHRRTVSLSDVPSQATPKSETISLSIGEQSKPFATVRRSPSLILRTLGDQPPRMPQRSSSSPVLTTLPPLDYEEKIKKEITRMGQDLNAQAAKKSGSLSSFTGSSDSLAGAASQIQTTPKYPRVKTWEIQSKALIQELKQHKSMQKLGFDEGKYMSAIDQLSERHKRQYEYDFFYSEAEKLKRTKPDMCNLTDLASIALFQREVLKNVKEHYSKTASAHSPHHDPFA